MKTCFVCPIYDKGNDFKFAINFLKSKEEYNIETDLYFVFSDTEQQKKFEEIGKEDSLYVEGIVIPDELRHYKNPIVVKKLYAIELLYSKYEYLVAVDCECLFVKSFNVFETLDNIWKNDLMLTSNLSRVGQQILMNCGKYLGLNKNEKLRSEFKDFSYNMWFNEIPVYKSSTLKDFFSWLDINEYRDIVYDNWDCYDYYVYSFFLILEKGYRLKKYNIISISSIMEELNLCNAKRRHYIEKKMGIHWTPNIDFYNNNNIVMFFHLDRDEKDEKYVSASNYRKMVLVSNLYFKHRFLYQIISKIKGWN